PLMPVLQDRLDEVCDAYLHGCVPKSRRELDLADPVVMLERGEKPARPLPPFFAACGTYDVLWRDTERLKLALEKLGTPCVARYYPKELHAFHSFVFRRNARLNLREAFDFLYRHVPSTPARAA
ncbi:MAG: alpha/beta hydrolase, partial [Myxococcales bacterium]